MLLTWAELTRMMQDAGYDLSKFSGRQSPGAEVFSRLKGGRLVPLSAVGFDAAKTRAMVTVQYNCFPSMEPGVNTQLCHQGNERDAGEPSGSLGAFENRGLRLDRLTIPRLIGARKRNHRTLGQQRSCSSSRLVRPALRETTHARRPSAGRWQPRIAIGFVKRLHCQPHPLD